MSRKGKKKPLLPRHKRMKRPARLQAAKTWLAKYPGKNVVTGYKKHFAVDAICALAELQMLGVKLDPDYVQRVRSSEQSKIEARRQERERKKAAATPTEFDGESDETFAYIAGYTGWGFPYGITWEEMEGLKPSAEDRHLKLPLVECAHEAPPGEEMTPERVADVLLEEAVPFDEHLLSLGMHRVLALHLFEAGQLTLSQAAMLADLTLDAFLDLLGKAGIAAVNYPPEELARDLKHAL